MFPYTPALSPLMALSDGLVRQLNGSSPASEAVQLAVLSLAVMFVASLLIDEETADQQGQQGPSEMSHPELPHEATADIAAHTAPTFAAPTPAPLVASATDLAAVPPTSVQAFRAAGLRSNTVTWWFERLMMLRHMGPPMLPTPMNPTFMKPSPKILTAGL